MTDPILRRACDRCHGQKLSCQRDNNDVHAPCLRCRRANTPCSTSPSQRNRRGRPLPRNSSINTTTTTTAAAAAATSPMSLKHAHDVRVPSSRSPSTVEGDANDGFHDSIADMLQTPPEGTLRPSPTVEAMDWSDVGAQTPQSLSSLDWTACSMNPFSVADFDMLNFGIMTPSMSPGSSSRRDGGPSLPAQGDWHAYSNTPPLKPTSTPITMQVPSNHQVPGPPNPLDHRPGGLRVDAGRPGQADGKWLQKLVELNVQLFNHANKAKASGSGAANGEADAPSDQEASTLLSSSTSSGSIRRPPGFNGFDETIVLAFYLVKALHSLYSRDTLKLFDHSPIPLPPPPNLDSGTTLIILSCYIRVLDLFMDRLESVRTGLKARSSPTSTSSPATTIPSSLPSTSRESTMPLGNGNGNGPGISLPTLVACGCALEGYPVLQLRLTLELVEEVLDVMSALVSPIVNGMGSQSRAGQASLMPDISPQALSAREQAAYRIVKDVRTDLKSHRRILMI